jgi:hypothetical protein
VPIQEGSTSNDLLVETLLVESVGYWNDLLNIERRSRQSRNSNKLLRTVDTY